MSLRHNIFWRFLGYWIVLSFAFLIVVTMTWKFSWKVEKVVLPKDFGVKQQGQQDYNVSRSSTVASPHSSHLLCHRFEGRMGNEMFQVASILGLAWAMNRTPVFVGELRMSRFLERSFKLSNQAELEDRCHRAHTLNERNCYTFEPAFAQLDPTQDFNLRIYLQSWKYFDKFRAQVKRALAFNQNVVKKAATIVEKIRDRHKKAILIGVHIRRGDFEAEGQKRRGYPMASPGFLNSSFTYFQRLFANCTFVIASENIIRWCRENTPPGAQVEYLDVHSPAVDMSVLVSMDHVITTFGSYSWWIGYLKGGPVAQRLALLAPVTNTVKVGCPEFISRLGHAVLSLHVASVYRAGCPPPRTVPSPAEKGGGLGVGPAPPPRKTNPCY